MRFFAGFMTLVALFVLLLPNLGADDKQEPAKAGNNVVDKKPGKKDVKKDDETVDGDSGKKKEAKKEPEDKLVYGQAITAKLKRMDANSARDFTIEVPQVDPMKVYQLNLWKMSEMNRIMRIPFNLPVQRAQQMAMYNMQLARKENTEIYTMKEMDLRAADNCKVRALSPPIEFDDKGCQKIFSQKELHALKGNSKLPGYPADFDRLNVGQTITVYLAKTKDQPKREAGAPKKKNPDDDDARPEAVLIVVVQEGPMQR